MANADDTKPATDDTSTTEAAKETVKEVKKVITLTKELEAKIIRQIEYYFGDINLPRDKFLLEQVGLDSGWVPISVLLTFNRLASICSEADLIAQALLNCERNLVIVSDDRKKVRRNPERPPPEYNEERRKELISRTAYVKGFNTKDTMEAIMKFFEEFGPFESLQMRSYKDKASKKQVFKGSIFVIFKTIDSCKEFLDKEEVKYNDKVLVRKWHADYIEEKKKEYEERNIKRSKNKKEKELNEESEDPQKPSHNFPKGAIVHMTGFKENTNRETIKTKIVAVFEKEPAYITFDRGDKEGYVRFSEENEAVEFVKKLTDAKFTVDEAEITVRSLEGEEEEKFLVDLAQTMSRIRSNHRTGRNKNRKRRGPRDEGFNEKRQKK